jgi:hypothetical protein
VYVSFWADAWSILGRMTDASDDVCDEADVVHSARMVVLCAMHELGGGALALAERGRARGRADRGVQGAGDAY